ARPLAEQRRDRRLVGELGAVVGEDGAEHAARPVGAEDGPDALQGVRDAPGGLLLQRQRELEPAGVSANLKLTTFANASRRMR
ncbi:hypothetical protein, partial [Collinsella sp. LCP19S3_B7]|uniref:hypothetical protein n=1 Tax=Collinsella sp. LCP19S3_B7 TaxID=3438756 RepID=UPI003F8EE372